MASSKLMDSSNSRNLEVRHRSSVTKSSMSELHNQPSAVAGGSNQSNLGHMSVNGYLQNLYGDGQGSESTLLDAEITLLDAAGAVTAISDNESGPVAAAIRRQESVPKGLKTVDDVWREIVAGRRECKQEVPDNEMMTLEDFLAKAGAVVADDVKIEPAASSPALETEKLSGGFFAFDGVISPPSPFVGTSQQSVDGVVGFGNGVEVIGGRGKRRALLEPLDKAAQQRQKRMIKNRESAARSRERKQAYQVELESLAVKLEEENEQLLRDKEEQTKERFKQLMEKVIPVVEMRKPARVLKRVHSMNW